MLPETKSAPIVRGDDASLIRYMQEIKKFPSLEADEEYMLAKRYQEHKDLKAAQKLITSHLKLVVKMAFGYRGYGLPLGDLVSEGNIGLMHAVKRYDPDRGFRLSTYAMWWIKASIQEYVLKSWSLVKIGTTAAQKKLFFNLRKIKQKIVSAEGRDLQHSDFKQISRELNVSEKEVAEMSMRMAGSDISLNKPMGHEDETEMINLIAENRPSQETMMAENQEVAMRKALFNKAFAQLNEREQHIINMRKLKDDPATLDDLSIELGISRERVRQLEARALEKLQEYVTAGTIV